MRRQTLGLTPEVHLLLTLLVDAPPDCSLGQVIKVLRHFPHLSSGIISSAYLLWLLMIIFIENFYQ